MTLRNTLITLTVAMAALLGIGCKDDAKPAAPAADAHDHDHDHGDAHDHGDEHKHDEHDHGEHATDEHAGHDHGDEAHSGEVTLTAAAVERWGIRVEQLARHRLTPTLRVPARVAFNAEAIAHVGSLVSGRVGDIKVRTGDAVSAGDVLIVIESPQLGEAQSQFIQRRSAIGAAEAAVAAARSQHERARVLYDASQGIALDEVQRREAEYRAAEGELVAVRSAATAAANALLLMGMTPPAIDELASSGRIDPRFVVVAPIGGRIVERGVTLGESVGPDRPSLMVIADTRTVWMIADVPESRLSMIAPGQTATTTAAAFADREFTGKVAFIGAQLDATTRSAPVRIEVANDDGSLRPGMFAEATIACGDGAQPVLAIPEQATATIDGATCVFVPVEGEANTFAKRVVRLGAPVGGLLPVLDGLREGDKYVAHGGFILKADLGKAGAAHEH